MPLFTAISNIMVKGRTRVAHRRTKIGGILSVYNKKVTYKIKETRNLKIITKNYSIEKKCRKFTKTNRNYQNKL